METRWEKVQRAGKQTKAGNGTKNMTPVEVDFCSPALCTFKCAVLSSGETEKIKKAQAQGN